MASHLLHLAALLLLHCCRALSSKAQPSSGWSGTCKATFASTSSELSLNTVDAVLLQGTSKQGAAQQWLVRDMQGNVAHVTAADLGEGGHRVHVIDRVLYSGLCLALCCMQYVLSAWPSHQ
jgi:hypothetical protein